VQLAALKRELEEALAAGRGAQGMKEECASLKHELKLLKDERYTPRQAAATLIITRETSFFNIQTHVSYNTFLNHENSNTGSKMFQNMIHEAATGKSLLRQSKSYGRVRAKAMPSGAAAAATAAAAAAAADVTDNHFDHLFCFQRHRCL
jgi:hypothetical protein